MNLYEKIKESGYYDNDPRGLEYYPDKPQDSSEDDNYVFDKATELERLHQNDEVSDKNQDDDSQELDEDDNSEWFRGEEGLKDWVKNKCHFDCDTYLRDDDQNKLDKAWNILWSLAQSYNKQFSKFKVHASIGDKDILLDISDSQGTGGIVFRITFPDPYNDVNQFKGVSAVIHGDHNFTPEWFELTQALSHFVL